MFKWFKKKPAPPSLDEAYKRAKKLAEEYNDLCFYISQIEELDQPVELYKYMEKADYMLCSTRDELQILYRRKLENRHVKRRRPSSGAKNARTH